MSRRTVATALGALVLLAAAAAGAADRPEGVYLKTEAGFEPLARLKVATESKDGIKRYLVPLGAVPVAVHPLQVLDLLPPTFHVYMLKLREDGLIFSWNAGTAYFEDEILFGPRYDEKSPESLLTWTAIEPGLWAFVESKMDGIGEVCYVFRVPPLPGDPAAAETAPSRGTLAE